MSIEEEVEGRVDVDVESIEVRHAPARATASTALTQIRYILLVFSRICSCLFHVLVVPE